MARGRHSDGSLQALTPYAIGILMLMAVTALIFWLIDGGDGQPTAAPTVESTDPQATLEPASPEDTPGTPEVPEPAETATETPAETPTQTESPSPTETESPAGDIDPADITIQVLDAVGDGGDAASALAAEMREDGYPVVAENQAVREYEQTTVFYTEGHEAEAQQVADQYGFSVVDEAPGNLSSNVDLHVVVGQDAA